MVDGVVGVYTLSVAEFNAAADFRHAAIAAERLASSPLATKGRKP